MSLSAYSFVGSTGRSNSYSACLSSQMSAQFRRVQATTRSGASAKMGEMEERHDIEIGMSRKPAQTVWALVCLDARVCLRTSPLVIMDPNPDAPKGGFSSQSYIAALRLFIQDNARIHTSRAAMGFLAGYGIIPIVWPAYSRDPNPIEHLR
jgi:hypothetical protein